MFQDNAARPGGATSVPARSAATPPCGEREWRTVDLLLAILVGLCLVALLIDASGRFGRPRFYLRGVAAWWFVAAVLAVIVVLLASG